MCIALCCSVLQRVAVCCSMLHASTCHCSSGCIADMYLLNCVAVYRSVLQRVAVCCSVLQCVAARCSTLHASMRHNNYSSEWVAGVCFCVYVYVCVCECEQVYIFNSQLATSLRTSSRLSLFAKEPLIIGLFCTSSTVSSQLH